MWTRPLVLLFLLAASGCGLKEMERNRAFEEATQLYWAAIRWGEYAAAAEFIARRDGAASPVDFEFLENIHVTDVQPKGQEPGLTPTEVTLLVGFRYYERSEGRIRSLLDRQRWYYAEDSKRWLLDSDLPDFAGQR